MRNIISAISTKNSLTLPIIIAAVFFAVLPLFSGPYYTHIFILVFLNVTLALGYRLSYLTGLPSFCHITFFSLGAYTSAIMTMDLGVPWGVGFICGGLLAGLVAVLFSWPAVRARGPYFFILSFGFYLVVDTIIAHWTSLTGGRGGLEGIPTVLGFTSATPYYYIA